MSVSPDSVLREGEPSGGATLRGDHVQTIPRNRGDLLTLRCGPMVHGGACISHTDDGTTVFIDGGIPGELVEVELRYRKRSVWFAVVGTVREADAARVPPPCRYVPACGGCQMQHVAYPAQLELKRGIIEDAMRRAQVGLPPEVQVYGMDDPWRYRWRGEFHVVRGGDGMRDAALGFNRARSWTPIAVDDCLIHHSTISRSLGPLRELVRRGATGDLNTVHLTVGEDGEELLLRAKPQRAVADAAIDAVADTLPNGLRWSTESTGLHWRGKHFRVQPNSFIQVNWHHMDVLYRVVLDALGDITGLRIVDAYAGIGVMSTVMADSAREVLCIEENRSSAQLGVLNAQMNGVGDRVRYIAEPVEVALPMAGRTDAIVLDPPRSGCDSRVTGWLALAGPPQVVYVSCDPATMARDLRLLTVSGPYEIDRFDVVDMFPQTYHVECVASLRRL